MVAERGFRGIKAELRFRGIKSGIKIPICFVVWMATLAAALGWNEEQARVMEGAVRRLVEEARQTDTAMIAGLQQQLQQVSLQASRRDGGSAVVSLLDTRLGKPEVFTGKEAKWEAWYFKFRAYMSSMGGTMASLLGVAEADKEVQLATLGSEDTAAARRLFLALVMLTDDAALRIVQSVTDENGIEALRRLLKRFNPVTQGRVLAVLNSILQVDLGSDELTMMDKVVQWEQEVAEFEKLSRETLPDIIKRAIIAERAPGAVRTHLLRSLSTPSR